MELFLRAEQHGTTKHPTILRAQINEPRKMENSAVYTGISEALKSGEHRAAFLRFGWTWELPGELYKYQGLGITSRNSDLIGFGWDLGIWMGLGHLDVYKLPRWYERKTSSEITPGTPIWPPGISSGAWTPSAQLLIHVLPLTSGELSLDGGTKEKAACGMCLGGIFLAGPDLEALGVKNKFSTVSSDFCLQLYIGS